MSSTPPAQLSIIQPKNAADAAVAVSAAQVMRRGLSLPRIQTTTIVLLGIVVLLLLLWEVSGKLGLTDPRLLPPFSTTVAMLWQLLGDSDFRFQVAATLLRIAVAFLIGAPLALLVGFALGERLHLGRVINPIMYFALAVPQSVFLPVFMLIFGIGFVQKVIFGITHIFFILCVTTIAAVRSIPRAYIKGALSYGASAGQIYRHIYFPAMAAVLVNGLRIGMIFNITGVLLAEMYSSTNGVGFLIVHWSESLQMAEMLAVVMLISIFAITFSEAMRAWERSLSGWKIGERSA
jgi:NitT/TauT family transport system permease protein